MRAALRVWLAIIVVAALAAGCATTATLGEREAAPVERLLSLIVERLAIAPDVARTKWNSKAPVEDLAREQQIVLAVGATANSYGVPRDLAERFFRGQIEASKTIQRAMIDGYEAAHQPRFGTVADLQADIRPKLDRLTPEMMRALADALPLLSRPQGVAVFEARSRRVPVTWPGGKAALETALAPLRERQ